MLQPTIMAIDPGLNRLGIAVGDASGTLVSAEVLRTDPARSVDSRLHDIGLEIDARLARFHPTAVLLEKTWPTSCRALALARRGALACRHRAAARHIPVREIPVTTVREAVVGWGWATKVETAQVVAAYYPDLQLYLRQDRAWKERHFQNLFDAVALLLYERFMRTRSGSSSRSPAPTSVL